MRCEQFREILSAMLDDEASPDEVEACARHLETCTACATYRDDLRSDREALRAWPHETLPPRLAAGTLLRRWLTVAAAVILGFLLGRISVPAPAPAPAAASAAPQVASIFLETQRTVFPDSNEVHSYVTLRTTSNRAGGEGGQEQ